MAVKGYENQCPFCVSGTHKRTDEEHTIPTTSYSAAWLAYRRFMDGTVAARMPKMDKYGAAYAAALGASESTGVSFAQAAQDAANAVLAYHDPNR